MRYLSGRSGAPLPEVRRRGRRPGSGQGRGATARAATCKQALAAYRRALRARAGEPDAAHVVRPALPAPRPQPGDRGGDAQGARPESGRDAQGHRLRRRSIEALRSRGQVPRGQPRSASVLLDEGTSNFAKHHRLLRDGVQPGGDGGGPRRGARATRSRRSTLAPDELKQFPLAALGWVHYKRRSSTRRSTSSPGRASSAPRRRP